MIAEQVRISDAEFNLFREFIYNHAGISLSDAKKALVTSRLSSRLRHYSLTSFKAYYDIVSASSLNEEQQIVIDLLTTNETYFFREVKHFDFLSGVLLKDTLATAEFKVWSAASSSGEEAYSIAMLLDDKLGRRPWKIFGSDINQTVLDKAREGLYLQDRIDGIPKNYLKSYCFKGRDEYEGMLLIDENLRRHVTFSTVNLTKSFTDVGQFNVIFLRNVMIYFDIKTKQKIINQLVSHLEPNGYLFIGHSESLKDIETDLKQILPAIYQKK